MDEMWARIESLRGRTLYTARKRPFEVVSVSRKAVTVVPESSGIPRAIRGDEFERAYSLRRETGPLTAAAVRGAGASEWNPVYVAAIVNAIA